jgi:hypothetical protein
MGELRRSRSHAQGCDYDRRAEYLPVIDRNTIHIKSPTPAAGVPMLSLQALPASTIPAIRSQARSGISVQDRSSPPAPRHSLNRAPVEKCSGGSRQCDGQRWSRHRDRFLVIRWMRHARFPARSGAESTIALRQQFFRAERRAEPRPLSRMNVPVVSSSDTQLIRYARVVSSNEHASQPSNGVYNSRNTAVVSSDICDCASALSGPSKCSDMRLLL